MARGDLRTAQIALRAMVRDQPQSAEAHFRLGAVQLQLGDAVAAEKELKLAQAGGWNRRAVMPLLARAYLAQGRFKDVLADFPVEGLPPEEAGPLLVTQRAGAAGAEATWRRRRPRSTEAERLAAAKRRGAARRRPHRAGPQRSAKAAEQKVDRALEINPRSVDALLLKGELQHARGRLRGGGRPRFTAALAVAPDAVNIRLERANTLIATQPGPAAPARTSMPCWRPMAATRSANYFLAVLLVRARDWQGADAALQKISPIISRFPRGDYFQALVKINLDQTEQAADAAAKYVARAPQDIAGYKLLARIHARARRPQQMIEVLTRAANAGLVDVELLELLGGAYIQTGQTALARADPRPRRGARQRRFRGAVAHRRHPPGHRRCRAGRSATWPARSS